MATHHRPLSSLSIRSARVLALPAALAAAGSLLSGCVAFEIRDSVRETNARLCELTPALGHTLHAIEDTRAEIDRTRTLLEGVQADVRDVREQVAQVRSSLDRTDVNLTAVGTTLGETNPKLNRVDGGLDRLAVLDRLNASLEKTNRALEPLASAAGLLGTLESGLGFMTGDALKPVEAAPASSDPAVAAAAAAPDASAPSPAPANNAPAPPTTGAPSAPAAPGSTLTATTPATPATPTTPKPADPLLGTWLLVYPAPAARDLPPKAPATERAEAREVVILRPDGTYLSAASGTPPQSGTWTRAGRSLSLSLSPQPTGTTQQPAAATTPNAPTSTYELLTLTTRTLTIRSGDAIRVYARP